MRLGIDFGTTRTRVAAGVRGNYPVVTFQTGDGGGMDWYPSLIAVRGGEVAFGPRAQAMLHEAGWEVLGSFKRLLGEAGLESVWRLGAEEAPALEWLTRFFTALRGDLVRRSNLELRRGEPLEAVVGVPATASGTQRFLTLEAFRRAGFDVVGMLNEPSAAGIEYAHRYRRSGLSRRREHIVVYDLGGGTFDVAVIRMADNHHDVVASQGIRKLGGEDFDEALLELALAQAAISPRASSRSRLLAVCREAKEAITPHTRKVTVDLGQIDPQASAVFVPAGDFVERCTPLIMKTITATEAAIGEVIGTEGDGPAGLAALYLVGGACELPALARLLRERFGWRVRRSPYPSGATAIGLAVAADQASDYVLAERFTRHFGLWREADAGRRAAFDPIFSKGTALPAPGDAPLIARRRYRPAHNIGRFRFLECSAIEAGEPAGDIIPWAEAIFPLDPRLADSQRLATVPVETAPSVAEYEVEEEYRCNATGIVEVTLRHVQAGYERSFRVRAEGNN
jgi:molecular chaperone DnaK (HSP70)